jgi:hypothetical protein
MKARPASRAGLASPETPAPGRSGAAAGNSHHPQSGSDGHPHHPQGLPAGHPHHPQAGHGEASAEACCPASAPGCVGEAGPDVRQPGCATPGCARRFPIVAVPEPGVLRPMARALLSVASEVRATRRDPLDAGGRPGPGGLRMGDPVGPSGGPLPRPFRGPFSRHSGADRVWCRVLARHAPCTPATDEPRLYG